MNDQPVKRYIKDDAIPTLMISDHQLNIGNNRKPYKRGSATTFINIRKKALERKRGRREDSTFCEKGTLQKTDNHENDRTLKHNLLRTNSRKADDYMEDFQMLEPNPLKNVKTLDQYISYTEKISEPNNFNNCGTLSYPTDSLSSCIVISCVSVG